MVSKIKTDGVVVGSVASLPTCDATTQSMLTFNTADNKMYYCDGTSWIEVGGITVENTGYKLYEDFDDNNLEERATDNGAMIYKVGNEYIGVGGYVRPEWKITQYASPYPSVYVSSGTLTIDGRTNYGTTYVDTRVTVDSTEFIFETNAKFYKVSGYSGDAYILPIYIDDDNKIVINVDYNGWIFLDVKVGGENALHIFGSVSVNTSGVLTNIKLTKSSTDEYTLYVNGTNAGSGTASPSITGRGVVRLYTSGWFRMDIDDIKVY